MDEKALVALVTPILEMLKPPEIKEVKTKPGKFIEKALETILKGHPLYSTIHSLLLQQAEDDPASTEKILAVLRSQLNVYFEEGGSNNG